MCLPYLFFVYIVFFFFFRLSLLAINLMGTVFG
jgi:hypothetical protein